MGKGSRNRQLHLQDKMENPQKYVQKKQAPKWLGSAICLVLVAAILIGVVASMVVSSGIIKRSRIVLESQSGKYDVTQQMATYLAWQEVYSSAYYYYLYCSYGIYEDTEKITKTFSSADQYALVVAQASANELLRDSVDDIMDTLKIYVAVCDEAVKNNIKLDAEDLTEVTTGIDELKKMQTSYGYASFGAFLDDAMGAGMKEKDVKAALTMVALYNKYSSDMQVTFEKATTLADLAAYRDENPDDYYKIDYLEYVAEDKAFAEELAACTTKEEFQKLVLEKHLEDNYKTAYNKYTTLVSVNAVLKDLSDKTDANGTTALTDALNTIEANATEELEKDSTFFDDKASLSSWLFNNTRKKFDKTVVTVDDGIYLAVLMSDASTSKVSARLKYYPYTDGDEDFKNNVFTYISESKKEVPSYPTVDYKTASTKATALKNELKAEGADIEAILKANDAVKKTKITSSTTATSTLPKAVITAATAGTVKQGDVLTTSADNVYYVIHVSAVVNKAYDFSFITVEGDPYYQIIDDLTASLDKVYPTDKTGSYDSDAEKDTFGAWISELATKGDYTTSVRKENDAKWFETKKKDETNKDKEVSVYTAYMIVKPLYLKEEKVVKGGYLKFSDASFATKAQEALDKLKGKTDLDLLNALSALGSATVSSSLTEDSVKTADKKLHEWLFYEGRQANDTDIITSADGKSAYVAVYAETLKTWESEAKTNRVTEQLKDWADELAKDYTPNEKVLNKLGKPTPETTDTSEDTTAADETTGASDLNG